MLCVKKKKKKLIKKINITQCLYFGCYVVLCVKKKKLIKKLILLSAYILDAMLCYV